MATITPEILCELKKMEERTYTVIEGAIKGESIVQRLKKNIVLVTGQERSENFFYRLGKKTVDYTKKHFIVKSLIFICLLYLTYESRGEKLIQHFETAFSYLRSLNAKPEAKDFWQAEEEITPLMSKRRTAFAKGDNQTAREINAAIVRKNQQLPVFLRKTKTAQRKRKRPKMTASK